MTGQIIAFPPRHALALEAESNVPSYRSMIERSIVLKYHAAIRAGTIDRFSEYQDFAARCWMLRLLGCDEAEDGAFPAPARPEDTYKLALVWQIGNDEAHIANRREFIREARVVSF